MAEGYGYYVTDKDDGLGSRVVLWSIKDNEIVSEAPLNEGSNPEALAVASMKLNYLRGSLTLIEEPARPTKTYECSDESLLGDSLCTSCPASAVCAIHRAIRECGGCATISVCLVKQRLQ